MKIAVCLYKYFPFGGLARDFLNIMILCRDKGHDIDVYTMEWQGAIPLGFHVTILPVTGWTNHGKVQQFINQFTAQVHQQHYDLVVGFNKIPGLDIYYAADPCYLDRVQNQNKIKFYRLNPRFRFYADCERAVFGSDSKTVALMISDRQRQLFQQHYATPDQRLPLLPPGIALDRRRPDNWQQLRTQCRSELDLTNDHWLLLMIGTGFKTKGVDRAIIALAKLPENLRQTARLIVVGEGATTPYIKLAKHYNIAEQVTFLGGRKDVAQLLLAADLLVHPARKDNTGTVIIEAIVAGLPVIVSAICGYATHVSRSGAGLVTACPFKQQDFNEQMAAMLQADKLSIWSKKGLTYAANEDLYSMPEKAADIIQQMLAKNIP